MKLRKTFTLKRIVFIFMLPILLGIQYESNAQTLLARWDMVNQATNATSYPNSSDYVIPNHGVSATENYYGLQLTSDGRYFFGNLNASTTLNTSTAPYLEYKIDLSSTKKIDFDRFVIYGFQHDQGKAQLRWSVDNYATSLGEFPTNNTYNLASKNLNSLPIL